MFRSTLVLVHVAMEATRLSAEIHFVGFDGSGEFAAVVAEPMTKPTKHEQRGDPLPDRILTRSGDRVCSKIVPMRTVNMRLQPLQRHRNLVPLAAHGLSSDTRPRVIHAHVATPTAHGCPAHCCCSDGYPVAMYTGGMDTKYPFQSVYTITEIPAYIYIYQQFT